MNNHNFNNTSVEIKEPNNLNSNFKLDPVNGIENNNQQDEEIKRKILEKFSQRIRLVREQQELERKNPEIKIERDRLARIEREKFEKIKNDREKKLNIERYEKLQNGKKKFKTEKKKKITSIQVTKPCGPIILQHPVKPYREYKPQHSQPNQENFSIRKNNVIKKIRKVPDRFMWPNPFRNVKGDNFSFRNKFFLDNPYFPPRPIVSTTTEELMEIHRRMFKYIDCFNMDEYYTNWRQNYL
ncbi:hypothetical protein A3Q56_05863 [Intoshia linei]|uniref:Uncharacterized protein n=1 Tax=Intoshia linei TaxID=1819745 RepID=A0A177AWH7_9BILA|nr:hypothetical protein A3Q56_05863 [Intoshia linei]